MAGQSTTNPSDLSAQPQRLLIICPTDTWGGVEKNVLLRARAMADRNHIVTVLLLENTFEHRFAAYPHIQVETMPGRPSDLTPRLYWRYYRLIKSAQPTSVFVPLKKDWWAATLCAHLAGVPNRVLYLGIKRKLRVNLKYRLLFGRFRTTLLVNSKDLRQHVLNSNRYLNRSNVKLIYNGFPLPNTQSPVRRDWRNKLQLPTQAWVIGCAGRFSHQKGFDLLPDILALLPEHVHMLVAGNGSEQIALQDQFTALGLEQRIHILGAQSDMESFYRALDCFLLPSRNEGMANVLNEALSFGLPVVSTQVSGSAELLEVSEQSPTLPVQANVQVGRYGMLTDINDTEAMAAALNALLDQKVRFTPEQQRSKISRDHDPEVMMNLTEQYLFAHSTEGRQGAIFKRKTAQL